MIDPSRNEPSTRRFSVTSVGSAMLRLSTDPGEVLTNARSLRVDVGGAEANALIALAHLGHRVGWFSTVADNPIGRRIVTEIRGHGVDVAGVTYKDGGSRAELLFFEYGSTPRAYNVVYDRRGAPIESLDIADLNAASLLDTRLLHLTGILPALSRRCRETTLSLVDAALDAGVPISLDINYRSKLWECDDAAPIIARLARSATLLFIGRHEARLLFDMHGSLEDLAQGCQKAFGTEIIVAKGGRAGAVGFDGADLVRVEALPTDIVDRHGAGDAFAAGVIHGYLKGSLYEGLAFGNAMAALTLTTHGDVFLFDSDTVERLLIDEPSKDIYR